MSSRLATGVLMDASGFGEEEEVVRFNNVNTLAPSGNYNIEFYHSFFRIHGVANDFKIQYSSVVRLFLLPKPDQHVYLTVILNETISEGENTVSPIVFQFETGFMVKKTLLMNEDLLNNKYKDRLRVSYLGFIDEVFTLILRGLSGKKVTRPGQFRSSENEYGLISSLGDDHGVLYPLEKGFFFLPIPPVLIIMDEISYVDFQRHGSGAESMRYFDLLVRLKNEQEHVFLNISRIEYDRLVLFISKNGLKIRNFVTETADGVPPSHLERIRAIADGSDDEIDLLP